MIKNILNHFNIFKKFAKSGTRTRFSRLEGGNHTHRPIKLNKKSKPSAGVGPTSLTDYVSALPLS